MFDPTPMDVCPSQTFLWHCRDNWGSSLRDHDNSAMELPYWYVVKTFYGDVIGRYSIDSSRSMPLGFREEENSGPGSLWRTSGGYICSAGLPGFQLASGTHPFVIAALDGVGILTTARWKRYPNAKKETKSSVYIYYGAHAWPSREQLALALLFLHLKAMQDGIVATDHRIVICLKNALIDSLRYYHLNRNIADEFAWAERGASLLSGYKEAGIFRKRVRAISSSSEFRKYLTEKEQVLRMEEMLRMEYQKAFTEKDTAWWRKEANVLRSKLDDSSDGLKKAMHERLLAYLSIMAYTYTNRSLQAGNREAARHFVAIYGIIDPKNPDYLKFRSPAFRLNQIRFRGLCSLHSCS